MLRAGLPFSHSHHITVLCFPSVLPASGTYHVPTMPVYCCLYFPPVYFTVVYLLPACLPVLFFSSVLLPVNTPFPSYYAHITCGRSIASCCSITSGFALCMRISVYYLNTRQAKRELPCDNLSDGHTTTGLPAAMPPSGGVHTPCHTWRKVGAAATSHYLLPTCLPANKQLD